MKFKEAELVGFPVVVVVGRKWSQDGLIEVQQRNGEDTKLVQEAEVADSVNELIAKHLNH